MKSKNTNDILNKYFELDKKMRSLTNTNPHLAIKKAQQLTCDDFLNEKNIMSIKAGVFIDAGAITKNIKVIDEGIALLEKLLEEHPDRFDIQYSLANGLAEKANLVEYSDISWYMTTHDLRQRSRSLYYQAHKKCGDPKINTKITTNLGNNLIRSYRFIEAYDYYLLAIKYDSSNGVALTGAARILLTYAERNISNKDILLGIAAKYLKSAKINRNRIYELAGKHACRELYKLLNAKIEDGKIPNYLGANDYQKFIIENRLALTPSIEEIDLASSHWDSLHIQSITESIEAGFNVPPIFAMFNILKSDYLAARLFAYKAIKDDVADSGKYYDTLDYARYGVQSSILTISQKICVDILDKIAVAVSAYLGLTNNYERIYFSNFWKEKNSNNLKNTIYEEMLNNTSLIALYEVATDIEEKGFLQEKKKLRHTSTHRFAVLHDIKSKNICSCKNAIIHYDMDDYKTQLIESLQLIRSALFYFVDIVHTREHRIHHCNESLRVPIAIPDHDWVRSKSDGM